MRNIVLTSFIVASNAVYCAAPNVVVNVAAIELTTAASPAPEGPSVKNQLTYISKLIEEVDPKRSFNDNEAIVVARLAKAKLEGHTTADDTDECPELKTALMRKYPGAWLHALSLSDHCTRLTFSSFLKKVRQVAYSPDGRLVALAGSANKIDVNIYLFDLKKKELYAIVHYIPAMGAYFAAGKHLTGEPFHVKALTFSPDSKYLAIRYSTCQTFVYVIEDPIRIAGIAPELRDREIVLDARGLPDNPILSCFGVLELSRTYADHAYSADRRLYAVLCNESDEPAIQISDNSVPTGSLPWDRTPTQCLALSADKKQLTIVSDYGPAMVCDLANLCTLADMPLSMLVLGAKMEQLWNSGRIATDRGMHTSWYHLCWKNRPMPALSPGCCVVL